MKRRIIVILIALSIASNLVLRRMGVHFPTDLPAGLTIDRVVVSHPQFLLAMSGWGIFSVYWESAKKNASVAVVSETRASRSLHVVVVNVAMLMVVLPIHGLGRFLPASSALMTAGLLLEALSLTIAIWARRHLAHHWSGAITRKAGHELIRTGPYMRLRHPIYTGILGMYVGTTIVTGEWLALIGSGLAVIAYWRKIGLEEANLVAAFGADYEEYRRESWALIYKLF